MHICYEPRACTGRKCWSNTTGRWLFAVAISWGTSPTSGRSHTVESTSEASSTRRTKRRGWPWTAAMPARRWHFYSGILVRDPSEIQAGRGTTSGRRDNRMLQSGMDNGQLLRVFGDSLWIPLASAKGEQRARTRPVAGASYSSIGSARHFSPLCSSVIPYQVSATNRPLSVSRFKPVGSVR